MPAERQADSSPPPHTTSLPTHRLSRAERTKIGLTPRPSRIEQLANAHPSDETDDATLSEHFSSPSSTDSSLPRSPELTKTSTGFTNSKAWADMTEEDLALKGPPRLPTPTWADGDDVRHAPATRDKLIVKTRPTSSAGMRQRPSTDSTLGSPVDLPVFKNRPFIRSSSESQAFPSAQQRQASNNVDDSSDEGSPSAATPEPQSASSGPPDVTISQEASPAAPATATLPATSAWDEPVQPSSSAFATSTAPTPEWHPPPILSRNAFLARPLRGRGRGRGSSDSYRSPYAERPFISQTPRHLASSSSSGWRSARPPQPPVDTWDEAQFPPLPTSSSVKPAAPLPSAVPSATRPPAGLSATSHFPVARPGWQQDSPQRQGAAATTHMRNERGEWTGWGRGGGGYSSRPGPSQTTVPKQHHPLPPRPSLRSRKPELSSWDDVDTSPHTQPQSREEQPASNSAAQQADDGWGPQHPVPESHATSTKGDVESEERPSPADDIVEATSATLPLEANAAATVPTAAPKIDEDAVTTVPIPTGHATLTVDSANSNDRSSISSLHSPSKNRRGFPWQSPFSHAIDTNDGKKVELKQTRDSPGESFDSQFDEGVTIGDRKAQRYLDPDTSPKASRFDIGSIKLKLSSKEGEESADEEIQEAIKRRRKRVTVACQTDPRQEEQVVTHHVKQPSGAAAMPVSPQQPLFVSMHESHRSVPTGFAVDANNYLYGISGNPVVGQWPAHSAQYFQPPISMMGPGFGGQAPAILQQYAPSVGPIEAQLDAQHLAGQPQYVVAQKPNASAVQLRQLLTSNGESSTAAPDRRSQVVDDFDPTAVPPSTTDGQATQPPSGPSLSVQPKAQPYLSTQQPATDATTEAMTQAARDVMTAQFQSHPAHQHQAQQPHQPALAPASALQPGTWTWTGPPPMPGAPYYAPPYQAAQGDPAAMPPPGSWVPATEASEQAQDGQGTVEEWVSGPVVESHPSQQAHAVVHQQQHHYSNATAAEIGYPFASPEWAPLASGQPPNQAEGYVPYPRPPQRSPERAPSAAARGHHRPGAAAHATSWRSNNQQQQQQYAQGEAAEHDAQTPPHPTGPRQGQNAGNFCRPNYQHHHHPRPPHHHHQQYAHQQQQQNFIPTSPMASRPPTQPAQYWQHQPQQPQQGGLPARPPPSAPTGPAAAATSPQAQHQYYVPPHMQQHHQQHHQFQPQPYPPSGQPYYSHHTAAAAAPPLYPRAGQGKRGSYGGGAGGGGGGGGGRNGNEATVPAVKAVAVMQEGTGGQQKVALQLKEAGVGTGEG